MGGRGCLQKVMSPHRKNEYRKFLNYSDRHGAKQRPCIENLLGDGGGGGIGGGLIKNVLMYVPGGGLMKKW